MAKEVKETVATEEGNKIISGLENGSNIEHCLTLSNIYKNLCN